jgi:hypothetical protein
MEKRVRISYIVFLKILEKTDCYAKMLQKHGVSRVFLVCARLSAARIQANT